MRNQSFIRWTSLLVILGLALALGAGSHPAAWAQGGDQEPAHLVLAVADGGEARINRMDWDVNAFAPVFPGTDVRGSDYLDISGRTTLLILCTDLSLIEQRGSEVPRCNPYPDTAAFLYVDDPAWTVDAPPPINVLPADLANVPPEVTNPGAYVTNELTGGQLEAVMNGVNAILSLNAPPDARAFALSSFYRSQGVIFEALGALVALPDLGCTARRPSVEPPAGGELTLAQSPVTYLRLGELYDILGQKEDALRSYRCAANLGEALNDPSSVALGYARQANLMDDPVQAIQFYQIAIDNYAALGAMDNANVMLEICGLRNCTLP